MTKSDIFYPVLAQVILIFAVWIKLYIGRLGSIYKNKIKIQSLADAKTADLVFGPAGRGRQVCEDRVLTYNNKTMVFE